MRLLSFAPWCVVLVCVGGLGAVGTVANAQVPETFGGEKKQACEAVMCLSSGDPPHECNPSLKKFFSIKAKKPWKTIKKRKDFLKKCPSGAYEGKEEHLSAIAEGGGRCTMEALLAELNVPSPPYTKPMPEYCSTLVSHEFTEGYDLPILMEHCYTDHLQELGPEPQPVWDWASYDGYSDEPPMLNTEEVEAYKRKKRLQSSHPTPICVTMWIDPAQPVPREALNQLLAKEVARLDRESQQYASADDGASY